MEDRYDVVVVGSGIVGLAHALAFAKKSLRVVVLDRSARPTGATIRNFGMVWPIGQPLGQQREIAIRTRQIWLELTAKTGLWASECGSLHLAHREDEWNVLQEFYELSRECIEGLRLLNSTEALRVSPGVNSSGLLGALWSPYELCVNPAEAIEQLAKYLVDCHHVEILYEHHVCHVETGLVRTSSGTDFKAGTILICSGADFETLLPNDLVGSGLVKCKLQMLKTTPQPNHWRIGSHLASGLTLRHYQSFRICSSLSILSDRVHMETPELDQFGIHVMASQNSLGEVILGDSHEYGDLQPFRSEVIDELILRELRRQIHLPNWQIANRWSGVYAKHPTRFFYTSEPMAGVRVVTGLGGAGMTLSFGIAEKVCQNVLESLPF